eukprot:GHVQ01023643.1.p2 GENE.GHVQ01023643.1~~GHVQ01023643.1.p2  ORF type:complete len:121 (+),score=6.44 GHVQ01023643.1:158-520(+)
MSPVTTTSKAYATRQNAKSSPSPGVSDDMPLKECLQGTESTHGEYFLLQNYKYFCQWILGTLCLLSKQHRKCWEQGRIANVFSPHFLKKKHVERNNRKHPLLEQPQQQNLNREPRFLDVS